MECIDLIPARMWKWTFRFDLQGHCFCRLLPGCTAELWNSRCADLCCTWWCLSAPIFGSTPTLRTGSLETCHQLTLWNLCMQMCHPRRPCRPTSLQGGQTCLTNTSFSLPKTSIWGTLHMPGIMRVLLIIAGYCIG